jgi:hypothetical protein
MTLRIRAILGFGLLLACSCATAANNWAYSELNKTIPGQGGNSPEDDARPGEYYFMRGVEAFQANDFGHAVKMYEAAASWGYKNAQYNLAVMYARGQGLPADLPRAMAWAALAAERNDKQYVQARELIYASLDTAQWDQANVIWRDLKKEYADEVALARAKARWAEVRNSATGSHVGSSGGHVEIGTPTGNSGLVKTSQASDPPPGQSGSVPTVGSTAADIAGPNTVEGTIAYGRLRSTDNPYDPKLLPRIGTATVGSPVAPDAQRKSPDDEATPQH